MRILHVGNAAFPATHGVAHAISALAAAEAALGHEVTVASPQKDFSTGQHADAARQGVRLLGQADLAEFPFSDPGAVDIVHFHYMFQPKHVAISRELTRLGIPYVVSPHGAVDPMEYSRGLIKRFKKRAYFALADRPMLRRSALVRCVTQRESEHVVGAYAEARTIVLPNGVPGPNGEQVSRQFRTYAGIRLGYLGRLDPYHKGLDVLVEVQRVLIQRGLESSIALAGKPTERDRASFEKLLTDVPTDQVHLAGVVEGESKWSFLRSLDFYAQLSRWELFGISMVEAMVAGTPVIASAACDLADELRERDLAFVVDGSPDDIAGVIERAADDQVGTAERAERARSWAMERFGPREIAARMVAEYQELIPCQT